MVARNEVTDAGGPAGGRPWPGVGRVRAGSHGDGTGFAASSRHVLTAAHILGSESSASFEIPDREPVSLKLEEFSSGATKALQRLDLAVMRVDPPAELPTGVRLGELPRDLPTAFFAWGYRSIDPGEQTLLFAMGTIMKFIPGGRYRGKLQLESRNVRPGMSGAPIALTTKPVTVTAVALARRLPEDVTDHEWMAFGAPLQSLPSEVIEVLGGLATVPNMAANRVAMVERIKEIRQAHERRADSIGRGIRRSAHALALLFALGSMFGPAALVAISVTLLGPFAFVLLTSIRRDARQCSSDASALALVSSSVTVDKEWAQAVATLVVSSRCEKIAELGEELLGGT